ncbi:hypothetical protein KY360_05670 [Candidatus Woesearchaeota archaeon]|nr:hypothetical protein [Candidatus Woesearchaeota archaeon]
MAETEILTASNLRKRVVQRLTSEGRFEQLLEESLIADTEQAIIDEGSIEDVFLDNSLEAYGANKKDMSCFRAKAGPDKNYEALRQIFFGLYYAEGNIEGKDWNPNKEKYGAPHEMLATMNTSEVFGFYSGLTMMIEGIVPEGKTKPLSREELKEMKPEKVVSMLVGYGYSRRHVMQTAMAERGCYHFPTEPGDLAKRIKSLSQGVKDKIMNLLDVPKRDIPDPCYDKTQPGNRRAGPYGKNTYIKHIEISMAKLHKTNTKA